MPSVRRAILGTPGDVLPQADARAAAGRYRRIVGRRRDAIGGWLLDVIVALGSAEFAVVAIDAGGPDDAGAATYGFALAHSLPLVVRRRYPRVVLAWTLATAALASVTGPPVFFLGPAVLVALYTVASSLSRRQSIAFLGAAEALWALSQVPSPTDGGTWALFAAILATAWTVGDNVHRRQDHAAVLARQAVAEERLRIARELHDVVAHRMSVIAVQSAVGGHVIDQSPDEARKALAAIEQTSRDTLAEMRRLLGVLRSDGDGPADLMPAPGLGVLDALADHMREAGIEVEVRVEGRSRAVPAGLDLSAYRIVQEALTNVVKHSGATSARVVVGYRPDGVTVEVTNDGTAPAGGAPGHGLTGMRERVALFGGELEAGPVGSGGFRVAARLPLP